MKKIQVISYGTPKSFGKKYSITYSSLSKPKTLDNFDINIVDLQVEHLWKQKKDSKRELDSQNDFRSVKMLLNESISAKNIIILPKNYYFRYAFLGDRPQKGFYLKDDIEFLRWILPDLLPNQWDKNMSEYVIFDLTYENSETICGESTLLAEFHFEEIHYSLDALTWTRGSNKPTTICEDNCYLTTLQINEHLEAYLREIGLDSPPEELPVWLMETKFFNDDELLKSISENEETIEKCTATIEKNQQDLEKNNRYKSILVNNGDRLVDVVFEMLDEMLDYDLSGFVDEKKEDFLIKKPTITFVGEIKGVTSNVRSGHVSQLETHCQTYLDELEDQGVQEEIKGLLIISPFRDKPLDNREKIAQKTIEHAARNNCLIITTEQLLILFEGYRNGKVTTEQILNAFTEQTGEFKAKSLLGE